MATAATGTIRPSAGWACAVSNNEGLLAQGQNIWTADRRLGRAVAVVQGAANAPLVVAGALEGSNVDMADEFTRLIQAQRGYQLNSKVVQAWDDIERMANELTPRMIAQRTVLLLEGTEVLKNRRWRPILTVARTNSIQTDEIHH